MLSENEEAIAGMESCLLRMHSSSVALKDYRAVCRARQSGHPAIKHPCCSTDSCSHPPEPSMAANHNRRNGLGKAAFTAILNS